MKKIVFLLFLFALSTSVSQAQRNEYKLLFDTASRYFDVDNFEESIPYLLKLHALNTENANINFHLGLAYLHSPGQKEKSIHFLESATKNISFAYEDNFKETTAPAFAWYFLGRAYMLNYKFDEAITATLKFKEFLTVKQDKDHIFDADRQIASCYVAKRLVENPLEIEVDNLGNAINTAFPEYSPVVDIDRDSLFFTSRRKGTSGGMKEDNGLYFEDIYLSVFNKDGSWKKAVNLGKTVNTPRHEAVLSLSYDRKQLFIYKDDNGDGSIYVCKRVNRHWGNPEKLPKPINSKAWETHACLSSDGRTLYFTSNRKGGYGGLDIYKCIMDNNGNWGEAINLGTTINTPYNEEGPSIMPDGKTIYFCSQGHETMGGYDIFSSKLSSDGFWSTPVNIGYPINTPEDELFYNVADSITAYFASDRPGGYGNLDIYKLKIIKDKQLPYLFLGLVLDAGSFKELDARFEVFNIITGTHIADMVTDSLMGKYYFSLSQKEVNKMGDLSNYAIRVSKDGYTTAYDTLSEKMLTGTKEIYQNYYLTRTDGLINPEELEVGKTIALRDIYYDFDKADLRQESIAELNRLLNLLVAFPKMEIEIGSHTDNRGDDLYNMDLSKRRAESVVNFLISKGIDKSKLMFKGYGETIPIATNTTDEGRQLNRRTEFKIIRL